MENKLLQDLEKDFTCPACSKFLCNTVVTACGTKICRYCLVIYIQKWKRCPACGKGCTHFLPYPKIDVRIATVFQKIGLKLREERQAFLNHRKLLQQKFDLEQVKENNRPSKESTLKIARQTKPNVECGPGHGIDLGESADWKSVLERKRKEILNGIQTTLENEDGDFRARMNVRQSHKNKTKTIPKSATPLEPTSSKKMFTDMYVRSPVGRSTPSRMSKLSENLKPTSNYSNTSLQRNSHAIQGAKATPSRSRTSVGKGSQVLIEPSRSRVPKFENLASLNEANEKLSEELNNSYQRFLNAAQNNEVLEDNFLSAFGNGCGDPVSSLQKPSRVSSRTGLLLESPIYHALDRISEFSQDQDFDFEENMGHGKNVPRNQYLGRNGPALSRQTFTAARKPQANDLLERIDEVRTYLKETALEALISDTNGNPLTSISNQNATSRQAKALLKNVLEIQVFLEKRVREAAANKKDEESQTEMHMCELLGSAANLLKEKVSKSSLVTSSGLPNLQKLETSPVRIRSTITPCRRVSNTSLVKGRKI